MKANSLSNLTKSFFKYIEKRGEISIKDASEDLNVIKRRIYDVLNVFEGK